VVFIIFLFFLIFTNPVFAVDPIVKIGDFSSNSDPEWVKLTNNTSSDINLINWVLRDFTDNSNSKDSISLTGCLSPNSYQIFFHNKGWLNDSSPWDTIYLYDQYKNLIDNFTYTKGVASTAPESTNTCVSTSITTPISTPTTPIIDPIIVNPTSGISLTEFMPYSSIEWIEIYNQNDFDVKLVGWKLGDSSSVTKSIPDLLIKAKNFSVFEFSSFLNNDDGDKVVLFDNNKKNIDEYGYNKGSYELERSWSKVNGSWCKAEISKNGPNVDSCFTPTSTIIPTSTPTPDLNRYESSTEATASVVFLPIEENIVEDTPTPTPTSGLVLGDTTIESTKTKQNWLPLIFIISGGLLLLTPLIITKIKKH